MEFDNNIPIYLQIIKDIKIKIVKKELLPGQKMPSARELAIMYKINPNTAARVNKELEIEGVCFMKRGLGTFVSEDESKVEQYRDEMAYELTSIYLQGMKQLGFNENEISKLLEDSFEKVEA